MTAPNVSEHIVEGVYDHLCRINGEWQPIGPNDIKEILTAAAPHLAAVRVKGDDLVERVARAWASIDGKSGLFDECKASKAMEDQNGTYEGYMAEARELIKRAALEPSAARELALEALKTAYASMDGSCSANHRIAMNTVDTAIRALSSTAHADAGKVEGYGLPQDVINLVIAAREVWEEADTLSYYHTDEDFSQRVEALDKALEPFGERVSFENEPDALPSALSEGAE